MPQNQRTLDFDFQPLAVPGFARSARKLGAGIGADDG